MSIVGRHFAALPVPRHVVQPEQTVSLVVCDVSTIEKNLNNISAGPYILFCHGEELRKDHKVPSPIYAFRIKYELPSRTMETSSVS
jgi:hypothetical protein